MNRLARSCWIASSIYLIGGMIFGIWMSASGDHSLAPAHAHLNLVGGVLVSLFGAFYALCPAAANSLLAKAQVITANLAAILITPGIAMAINGDGDILAKIGSLLALAAMVIFLIIVVRDSNPLIKVPKT